MRTKAVQKSNEIVSTHFIRNRKNQNRKKTGSLSLLPDKLSHNQLVMLMAENPENEGLWREFTHRFANLIAATIIRESNRLNFTKGCENVNDLLQEVYLNLLNHNYRALKNFRGRHKNSIVRYLMITATHVVRNHFSRTLCQKRKQNGAIIHLDDGWNVADVAKPGSEENLRDRNWNAEIRAGELIEEVEYCLKKVMKSSRHPRRDMQIFRYYLYGGLQATEIATLSSFNLTEKRISNLLADMKKKVGKYLSKKTALVFST